MKPISGGGLAALTYTWKKGREAGGVWRLYRRLRARNAGKTCAYGMGGQSGGMVNEGGSFPEVCKKSIQAQAGDMQRPIPDSFWREHSVAELESWTPMRLEYAGRLARPVAWREGDTHFAPISWEEALDRVASELKASPPGETFFYASGRSSNEAAFLLQTFARAYGTANIHNCSYYCHQASGVALSHLMGSGTASVVLDDLDRADLALVAGANPASNHPRLIVKLVELRKRGGTVIVVNPVKELGLVRFRIPSRPGSFLCGSDVSDLYLQPHVGGDVAVFKASSQRSPRDGRRRSRRPREARSHRGFPWPTRMPSTLGPAGSRGIRRSPRDGSGRSLGTGRIRWRRRIRSSATSALRLR